MKLSKRLNAIATEIPDGSRVLDIGCDHAFLDIYLTKEKGCRCVASDINENALKGARFHIQSHGLEEKIPVVCAPGIEGVMINEGDYVVISGMGTMTMIDILSHANRKNITNLVLQSNRDLKKLRKAVVSFGYKIEKECMVEERDIMYIILFCTKGDIAYTELEYEYGPYLLKHDSKYISCMIKKETEMYERIPDTQIEKKISLQQRIEALKKISSHFIKRR